MTIDAISLLQFATTSAVVVGLKVMVPRVYKAVRAQRRLSGHLVRVSEAHGRNVRCDARSLLKLHDQLNVLLESDGGLSQLAEVYLLNKAGDGSLETVQLFGTAFRKLHEDDRWIIEHALRYATQKGRISYLKNVFVRAGACRRNTFSGAKDG